MLIIVKNTEACACVVKTLLFAILLTKVPLIIILFTLILTAIITATERLIGVASFPRALVLLVAAAAGLLLILIPACVFSRVIELVAKARAQPALPAVAPTTVETTILQDQQQRKKNRAAKTDSQPHAYPARLTSAASFRRCSRSAFFAARRAARAAAAASTARC